ncbi:MAG: SUF system Fe-S cluster assembly protein [Gammaproteobacteria bacterium]|nr:MAG: SUF system Fe-S cluster assembly protein [Gammaproteobacteria bacterium]
MNDENKQEIKDDVIEMLKTIFDPEIPVNIYELGLIYDIEVSDTFDIDIKMTLTAPGCPVAQTFPGEIEEKIATICTVNEVKVEIVWEPTWTKDMMGEAAKLQLGMF